MSLSKAALYTLYFCFLIAATLYVHKRPAYNWDMLGYIAVVLSVDESSPQIVHKKTYAIVKSQVPASHYRSLTDTTNAIRRWVTHDPSAFKEYLPFYTLKPLYLALVYVAYKAGVPMVHTTLIPSTISYFCLGILLLVWLRRYLSLFLAVVTSILLMVSAPVINVAALSTPDCLSAFLLLTSFYFMVEEKRLLPAYIFMLLAIFARIDNIIIAVCLVTFLTFFDKSHIHITKKQFAAIILSFCAGYFIITLAPYRYGWDLLFFSSFFAKHSDVLRLSSQSSPLKEHFIRLHSNIMIAMRYYHFFFYSFLATLIFVDARPFKRLSFDQSLALLIVGVILIRILLYTDLSDRFFLPYFLLITFLLVRKISAFAPSTNREDA